MKHIAKTFIELSGTALVAVLFFMAIYGLGSAIYFAFTETHF